MWQVKDGAYNFVLIDFDMATIVENDEGECTYKASSKHRTGTLPFMAYELIFDAFCGTLTERNTWIPVAHLLRHEYESLFYLGFWCATALPDSPEDPNKEDILVRFAKKLEKGGLELLSDYKQRLLTSPLKSSKVELSHSVHDLKPWFTGLTSTFQEGVSVLKKYQAAVEDANDGFGSPSAVAAYDYETANGWLTRAKLKEILTPRIPARSLARLKNPEELPAPRPATKKKRSTRTADVSGSRTGLRSRNPRA